MTLAESLRGLKGSLQSKTQELFGTLGVMIDGRPIVNVPTRNGYVYVKIFDNPSELIQAKNTTVPPNYGTSVLLTFDGISYTVTGLDTNGIGDWGSHSTFQPIHAPQHMLTEGGGSDPIFLDSRQFIPLSVMPTGTWGAESVYINPSVYLRSDGSFHSFGGTGTPDLSGYAPADDTAVMLLIYCDTTTGNPGYILGDTYFDREITDAVDVIQYLPNITGTNNLPLGAIRLVSGTSSYLWANIYDVRQFIGYGGVDYLTPGTADETYLKLDGSNAPLTGGFGVDGSSNEVQFYLEADVAQSANIFENRRSGGAVVTSGFDERGILFSDGGTHINNLFAGNNAGNSAATGSGNIGMSRALIALTSGVENFGMGFGTLAKITVSSYNIGLGSSVFPDLASASTILATAMIGIGRRAGYKSTTAKNCLFIGTNSGYENRDGDGNIYIGHSSGFYQVTSNRLLIANQKYADAATELTNSIISGVMAATPAAQTLRVNAVTTIAQIVSATNTVTNAGVIRTESTGTVAAGFGGGLLFTSETATSDTIQNTALVSASWVDATNATRKAKLTLSAYDTAIRTGLEIEADGSAAKLGVLGASPIVRQAHIVDADGTLADITSKFNSLLAYLENFGFISTS